MKIILILVFILSLQIFAQPVPSHYYKLWQEDSLYYLLTDKALFKFYSHEASGEFYLTRYIEGNFNSSMTLALNDDYLFLKKNNSIEVYSNVGAGDLTYESTFTPGYNIYSIHGFGTYVAIRSGNYYNLLKLEGGNLIDIEDSLFTQPPQNSKVFFYYPYIVIANVVYKYVENYGIYAVGQISCGNEKLGLYSNKIIGHVYITPPQPPVICYLYIITLEEPDFPRVEYNNWGINVDEIHYLSDYLIPKKNLYYFTLGGIVTTTNAQIAYHQSSTDNVFISDNYIFLLGDSIQYSKWYTGSTFYAFTWTDVTGLKYVADQPSIFTLYQNYPNPFNPTTKIKYQLPELSKVKITIYDVLGREVKTLVNEEKPAGTYEVDFNGTNLPSGVYFYRIESGSYSDTKKFVLLK